MLPNSPFAQPQSSFKRPVPTPPQEPDASPLLRVTFNANWLPYIMGSLFQLLQTTVWDAPQGSPEFVLAQNRAANLLYLFSIAEPVEAAPHGAGGGDETPMIRQNPTNPCLLESSLDGTDWCVFADLSKCIAPSGQPGTGNPQPQPGGGQACYHAVLNANSIWNVPTLVNTGDTIQINNPQGASTNSHNANWYLTNGGQFFGGVDVGFPQTNGANPVPGADIGTLVVEINGTFYSLSGGTFTVPAGVSNASALIQVNDNAISGLSGQLSFDVCVTNNQAAMWSLSQNLALVSGGWTASLDGFDGGESVWTPGSGWQQVTCHPNLLNTARYDIVYVELTFAHTTTVKHVDIRYDSTIGDLSDGGGDAIQLFYGGAWHTANSQASANGTDRTLAWDGTQTGVSKIRVLLYGADLTGSSCPTPGTATFKSINANGTGVAPF